MVRGNKKKRQPRSRKPNVPDKIRHRNIVLAVITTRPKRRPRAPRTRQAARSRAAPPVHAAHACSAAVPASTAPRSGIVLSGLWLIRMRGAQRSRTGPSTQGRRGAARGKRQSVGKRPKMTTLKSCTLGAAAHPLTCSSSAASLLPGHAGRAAVAHGPAATTTAPRTARQ
ncbi:hypothetical protein M885DRAFT_18943 [Pelagophyceae sp. CCMP2097]|nr:hypothetical protein M885DRAFT_18943 [Pelagophyceae sp. CCMP2097]